MRMFREKTLARHLGKGGPIPAAHLERLTEWADMIRSGRIFKIKETALHGDFKAKIVEAVLGYTSEVAGAAHTVTSEKRILRGSVDLALGQFDSSKAQILAPFELKGAKTKDLDAIMPGRAKSPVQQAWEYATNAPGVKWVLVSNYVELRLYGFGEGTQAYEKFEFARLIEPDEYARFIFLLSAENLLSGRTLELLEESRKEDKDITEDLYSDYKSLRGRLIKAVQDSPLGVDPLDAIAAAQKILDRVLFSAFAEDTGLLPKRILEKAFVHEDPFNPRPIWENFKGLFSAIDKGNHKLNVPPYNGGLFAHDPIVEGLDLSDDVCEGFKALGDYDFASQVPVTVLGHIFEQSIADLERLQAIARGEVIAEKKASGTTGRRKRDGVVFTPNYVAQFIVDKTLSAHLRDIFADILLTFAQKGANADDVEIKWKRKGAELQAWEAYRDRLRTLRIVDPACGSGVFLVVAFDYMKAELTRVNDKIADLRGGARSLFDPDSEILTNNLFGVDVNPESVELAKLSLWVKTARRGKMLDSLDDNLKVGDSLVEDAACAYLGRAFRWDDGFPDVFADGGFDVVLGNPPYVRMEFLTAIKPYLQQHFEVASDRADLYCYFFERGLKILKSGGRMGYISNATFFKSGSGAPLRTFLRTRSTIEHVVDFQDLQIFEGVTTYPAILVVRQSAPPPDHKLSFWEVDQLPDSNFNASYVTHAQQYLQASLTDGSWKLEADTYSDLRAKIRSGRRTLKDVYGAPLYGIKTGRNQAFIVDNATKERLCARDPHSADLLKPYLQGADVHRWGAEWSGLWIIYVPKNRINIDDYPAIRDEMRAQKDALVKRATKQEWFELQQAQEAYIPHFEGAKIVYRDIADRPQFTLDTDAYYLANTCYFIPSDDQVLLAYLNSRVGWFFYKALSNQIRGGFVRYFNQFLEQMPVPEVSAEDATKLATSTNACHTAARQRLDLQAKFRRRILDLCPRPRTPKLSGRLIDWWSLADFAAFRSEVSTAFGADIPLSERSEWEDWFNRDKAAITALSAKIAREEAAIDHLLYQVFDLSAPEIELVNPMVETPSLAK